MSQTMGRWFMFGLFMPRGSEGASWLSFEVGLRLNWTSTIVKVFIQNVKLLDILWIFTIASEEPFMCVVSWLGLQQLKSSPPAFPGSLLPRLPRAMRV